MLEHPPDLQVLANLMDPNSAGDVSRPLIGEQSLGHCSPLSASFGNAIVELRRNLADGSALKPAVLPKPSRPSVSNGKSGRGEEEGFLQGVELQA
jgi:hypothetical protein